MNKNLKLVLILVGFTISIAIGFVIEDAISNNQYVKAKMYNTAIQADTTERFNYAVDSRQGNVLGSGTFSAREPVKIDDISGEYSQIFKNKERYTQHTETYSCGTTEHPITCTRTYYTWDYYGSEEFVSPVLKFHDREYFTALFKINQTRRLGCESIIVNCQYGYKYKNNSFWTSEGEIRWYYIVTDTSFFGTILVNTLNGTLSPINEGRISISEYDIPTVIKNVNNSMGDIIFFVIWILLTIGVTGYIVKIQIID